MPTFDKMDLREMSAILKIIGWKKSDLCRAVGIHKTTASRWRKVPNPVAAYLRLYLAAKEVLK